MSRETLPDHLRRWRQEKRWSCQRIAARAKEKGFKISGSYISRLESGEARNPGNKILEALAAGMDTSPAEISALARGESTETKSMRESSLLDVFWHLSPKRQDEYIALGRFFDDLDRKAKKKAAD